MARQSQVYDALIRFFFTKPCPVAHSKHMNSDVPSNPPTSRIDQMRQDYTLGGLMEQDVSSDPVVQFELWFSEANGRKVNAAGTTHDAAPSAGTGIPTWLEPNAMTLSTASRDGGVSSRTVLLKGIAQGHFIFYTSYGSTKGQQIADNPTVSLCFFWPHLQRQVLVVGRATQTDRESSAAYFHSRPHSSQLGAHASTQSSEIESRAVLEERMKVLAAQYPVGTTVPLPENWGGYAVAPFRMEFWQGRTNRLHDRIVYTRPHDQSTDTAWRVARLSP